MSEPEKDNALSRIYREGAWPEPSRQIDQAILAASRRAARERHSFVRRWAPSFAVAATVVLTSTLVLKAYREQPEVVSPSVLESQPATRAKQAIPAEEPKAAEAKSAAASPPPVPATPRGFTSTIDTGEALRLDRLQRDLGLKQGLPASESPLPAPKSAFAEKSAPTLKKEVLPHAQNALQAARQEPAQPQAAPAASPMQAETAAPPPSPAAGADAVSSNVLGAAVAARIASKAPERSPQTWIEDIRKLIAEGKLEQADRELADFKKRYPDYVLPENLR